LLHGLLVDDGCLIARKLKRSVGATHQKAMRLGVTLGGGRAKKPA
jgi:hypothetical protein